MIKPVMNGLKISAIIVLLVSNILTLSSSAFNWMMSDLLSSAVAPFSRMFDAAGDFKTVKQKTDAKHKKRLADKDAYIKKLNRRIAAKPSLTPRKQMKARQIANRINQRTVKRAALSTSSMFAESLPYVGIAAIVGATTYELIDYCSTFNDLNELYSEIGIPDAVSADSIEKVCNPDIPTKQEISQNVTDSWNLWGMVVFDQLITIKEFWAQAWEKWKSDLVWLLRG